MNIPESKWYRFRELLSDTPQIQTWSAIDRESNHRCVVKVPAPGTELDALNATLSNSFNCQRRLRSSEIVSARRKRIENRRVMIEYPYLDHTAWTSLTPRRLWSEHPVAIARVCAIIDHLHLYGVVHGDLKLENFLARTNGKVSSLVLIDLDFMTAHNSRPQSRLFGTPAHIAPEVVANDRVVAESDSYSLGISIQRYLRALGGTDGLTSTEQSKIAAFTRDLLHSDYVRRTSYLLQALQHHDIIDQDLFKSMQRDLLAKTLFTQWLSSPEFRQPSLGELRRLVVTKCRMLGLSDELLALASEAMTADRGATLTIVGTLLEVASINRYGDYWQVGLDDTRLLGAYRDLEHIAGRTVARANGSQSGSAEIAAEMLTEVDGLAETGRREQAFLTGMAFLDDVAEPDRRLTVDLRKDLYLKLGHLAQTLNRLNDAEQFLSRRMNLEDDDSPFRPTLLVDIVNICGRLGRVECESELIEEFLKQYDTSNPTEPELNLVRIKAWLQGFSGQYELAEPLLNDVFARAEAKGYHLVMSLAQYSLGVLHWRRGSYDEALKKLKDSLRIARDHNLSHKTAAILSTTALLYSELADYRTSAKYGRQAARVISESEEPNTLPYVCSTLAYAYTRLADYAKAEYWIQRYLDLGRWVKDGLYFATYYGNEGYLQLNRSNLSQAKQNLHKALSLHGKGTPAKSTGQIHFNLADVALQQGDLAVCREHCKAAEAAYRSIEDKPSIAETQMLRLLGRLLYRPPSDPAEAVNILESLVKYNCRYTAIRLLFYILVDCPETYDERLGDIIEPLRSTIHTSATPIFKAASILTEGLEGADTSLSRIRSLKIAARETLGAEDKFASLRLFREIGLQYRTQGKHRHAEKYLNQALGLADSLRNQPFADDIKELLTSVGNQPSSQASLIESFHDVSLILKDIDQPEKSLERLLQFAMDQTGAERAVLLLRRRSGEELYVAASLNCDQESIQEIASISTSVTRQVLTDLDPLIIDNALSDERTRNYNSVVLHNILSVACFPLIHQGHQQGVLYLDHNSLPSLFSAEDIQYIRAISNFISTVVATVRSYSGLSQVNIQLRQDLNRLGDTGSFVTADSTMLELLDQLPSIARTDVPVLIMGESGTGKEIICEIIHKASNRADMPLVKLNCAAIPESLTEAELFGVARNAATGVSEREGKLSAANGGSLFLDEIADMPLDVQAKLLRALEYQQFERVGSERTIHTDIRFIYATNKSLAERLKKGSFRQDLYYRINTIVLEIPPLRERSQDIQLLLEHFLQVFSVGKPKPLLRPEALQAILSYDWPGNVRELKNFVERCCILHAGQPVTASAMQTFRMRSGHHRLEQDEPDQGKKSRVVKAWRTSKGNQSEAARQLGMPLSTFRRKAKKYGLL